MNEVGEPVIGGGGQRFQRQQQHQHIRSQSRERRGGGWIRIRGRGRGGCKNWGVAWHGSVWRNVSWRWDYVGLP